MDNITGVYTAPGRDMHGIFASAGFTSGFGAAFYRAMTMDMFWSWFAMPIGLTICFWPFLIAWVIAERKSASEKKD